VTTLRVIVDDILAPAPGRLSSYAGDLTRALIATAPRGSDVAAVVAASPEPDYARIRELLPGLRDLHKSALARRELAAAWQRGFTVLPGSGMVHATSLLAPLRRHTRGISIDDQTVVTIHDAIAWTHPELLSARVANWTKGMAKRAERHADAIVVPTHAVADALAEHLEIDDRVRVIGGAPASALRVPDDAAERRARLGLPERYVVAVIEGDARNGFADLAGAAPGLDAPVVVLAAPDDSAATSAAPEGSDRVRLVSDTDDADNAAILAGAAVFVQPSIAAGFGAAMLDAMSLGIPVVAADIPALAEVAADAALLVSRGASFPAELADAVNGVLADAGSAERLAVAALDRAKAFTWHDAAEKVWQLHADL